MKAKEARLHPSWKSRRAEYRAEELRYAARSAAASTYQGQHLGGGAGAVLTPEEQADVEYLGSVCGGGRPRPPETKGE